MCTVVRKVGPVPHNVFVTEAFGLDYLLLLLPLLELVLNRWALLRQRDSSHRLKI